MRGVFRGVPLLTFLKRTSPYIHRIQLQCYFMESCWFVGPNILEIGLGIKTYFYPFKFPLI